MSGPGGFEDRFINLGPGLVPVPECLLLAHARGEVLFNTGAGSSGKQPGYSAMRSVPSSCGPQQNAGGYTISQQAPATPAPVRGIIRYDWQIWSGT